MPIDKVGIKVYNKRARKRGSLNADRREKMRIVETKDAPAAVGPYSQAVVENGLVYTSGQIPLDPESGRIEGGCIEVQADRAIRNLSAVLKASGSSLENVIKTTCYLTDLSEFSAFNEIYGSFFPNRPARSCVQVSALPKGAKVEIEAVATLL